MATIAAALRDAVEQLHFSDTPRLDAQILLAYVLQTGRAYLVAFDEQELTDKQLRVFNELVARRKLGEPVAYITGIRAFYDVELRVTPDVLIPRPETEHLIEAAIEYAKDKTRLVAADIGTGSGAIAVTIAKHCPQAMMFATDISEAALAVAKDNAETIGVSVRFAQGYLAQPLLDEKLKVDLLMANLPYIETDEVRTLEVAKHEPHLALDGGDDGLDLVRELLHQTVDLCEKGACILLEIGTTQGEATLKLADDILQPQAADIIKDYAGHERIVKIIM